MKKLLSLVLVVAMVLALGACGNKTAETKEAANTPAQIEGAAAAETQASEAGLIDMTEDPYEVAIQVVLLPGTMVDAEADMEAACNAITLPAINCTVDLQFVWISEVAQTTSLAIAGDEKIDIVHVATVSPLSSMVGSDMLYDLNTDNLLQTRGSAIVELMADTMSSGYVNGQQLAVPAKQYGATTKGFYYNKTELDKFGVTVPESMNLEEFYELLYTIKDCGTEMMPLYMGNGLLNYLYWLRGYDGFGTECSYGVIMDASKSTTVENFYATEEFKDFCLKMMQLRKDGILTKDTTDQTSSSEYFNADQLVVVVGDLTPSLEANYTAQAAARGVEVGYCSMTPVTVTTASVTEYMWGIASNCQRPDKAMDLLNLIYADGTLASIIKYGLEGVHYDFVEGSDTIIVPNGSYMAQFYEAGDVNKMLIQAPNDESFMQTWADFQASSTVSPILGYMFSDADYQTESSLITTAINQYLGALQAGMYATEEEVLAAIDEFNAALEAAGINDVIEGNQAQLDAFLASR